MGSTSVTVSCTNDRSTLHSSTTTTTPPFKRTPSGSVVVQVRSRISAILSVAVCSLPVQLHTACERQGGHSCSP